MSHAKLTDAHGNTLYFYQPVAEDIQFEVEFETPGNNDGAIALISDLGRGAELATDLAENIERMNQFSWISFDD